MIIRGSRFQLTRLIPNPIKDPGSMPPRKHLPTGPDPGANTLETTAAGSGDFAADGSGVHSFADSAPSLHQFAIVIAALSAENRELRESAMRFGDLAERLAKELRNERAMRLGARDERETSSAIPGTRRNEHPVSR